MPLETVPTASHRSDRTGAVLPKPVPKLREARAELIAALLTEIAMPHPLVWPAGRVARGEFVRELAEALALYEAVFAKFRAALVAIAVDAASDNVEAGERASRAVDGIEAIAANVADELVPHLRMAADLLLGEYGRDD